MRNDNPCRGQTMLADVSTVHKLMKPPRQLHAPMFQRAYVWEEEKQWQPLWLDILNLAERKCLNDKDNSSHFLGAIVLDQAQNSVNKPEYRSIIDGQQRLVTLTIFLAAFRDILNEQHYQSLVPKIDNLIVNGEEVDGEDVFKVLPTNKDKKYYKHIITAKSFHNVHEKWLKNTEDFNHKIIQSYKFFYAKFKGWLGNCEDIENKFNSMTSAVLYGLKIVVINMEKDDDPQVIFETLNARGTPLLPSDLIKNFLFRYSANEDNDLIRLYEKYWRQFDDEEKFWMNNIKQGRIERPRIDLFLHHLTVMLKQNDFLVSNLFHEYKSYVQNDDYPAETHFRDIKRFSNYFKQFYSDYESGYEKLFFKRLQVMEVTTVYPFLLKLYDDLSGYNDLDERVEILKIIESYLVRRLICQLTTQAYNNIFLNLLKKVSKLGIVNASIVTKYFMSLKGDSGRWPNNDELLNNILIQPLYKKMSKARTRMILEALNVGLETPRTESTEIKGRLTIEHIMPQSWQEHWFRPKYLGNDELKIKEFDENRNLVINTLGNLTLCTAKLNEPMANKNFGVKKKLLSEHTVLLLNKFINQTDEWNEEKIKERGTFLAGVAFDLWNHPA